MKKKIVCRIGATILSASMIFAGTTVAFASESTEKEIVTYDQNVMLQGNIETLERGQGYEISSNYDDQNVPKIVINVAEINTDLNKLVSELLDRSFMIKGSHICVYDSNYKESFTISKSNLEKIKTKGMSLEVQCSTDNENAGNPYLVYTFDEIDNITGDYTPSVSVNSDTKAINTVKKAGIDKFYTVTLNEKYGSKSLGNGYFYIEAGKNNGNFDMTQDSDGNYPGAKLLNAYYYDSSADRFIKLDKEICQTSYFYGDSSLHSYIEVGSGCKTIGTYVVVQGELPASILMDTYTGLVYENGNWNYYKNGKADASYTGLCKYNNSWWYVKNGKVDFSATTLCRYNGTWWYVKNGKVDFNATTLCYYSGTWWFVHNGRVDFSSRTLVKYNGTWWFVENGKVNWNAATVVKYGNTWYYVNGGKVHWNDSGLCYYSGNWWYIDKGKINFSARTLVKYNGTWWFVENGKVNKNNTTVVKYGNTWYYVSGGNVHWNDSGLCYYNGNWWYIDKGRINFSATTVVEYNGVWWYVHGGKVDFNSKTLCKYSGTWWFIEDGQINWIDRTLVKYGSTWYYVSMGKVNWGYNGECLYGDTFYTIKGGVVQFGAKPTITESQKNAQAQTFAKYIASNVTGKNDLEKVRQAAKIVAYYCNNSVYTNDDKDYRTPYGVLCKGVYTCSGATRTLGLVLECMGYKWEHVNENKWSHQWCKVYMDGKVGWADGMGGIADYGAQPPYANGGSYTNDEGVTFYVP